MFKIIKINTIEEAQIFSEYFRIISEHKIPEYYILGCGNSYLFTNKNGVIGGYSIIDTFYKRTIEQLPIEKSLKIFFFQECDEMTCYFITQKRYGFIVVTHFLWSMIRSGKRYFVYSYNLMDKKLEELYSHGEPFRIYSGRVRNLDGMTGDNFENVEIITRKGFLKLYLNRIFRRKKKDGFSS